MNLNFFKSFAGFILLLKSRFYHMMQQPTTRLGVSGRFLSKLGRDIILLKYFLIQVKNFCPFVRLRFVRGLIIVFCC